MLHYKRNRPEVDEVWAINFAALQVRHDLLFAMDDCRVQESRASESNMIGVFLKLLEAHPWFYTSTAYPEYPGAIEFPLEEACKILPLPYFNSTVAYAIAFAMMQKVEELHLYGVDFSYPDAHKAEKGRGCVEFLLGVAMARGTRVVLPDTTTLLDRNVAAEEKPYGYDAWHVDFTGSEVIKTPKRIPTAAEIEQRYKCA